eukprot:3474094-Rhodomonas_salina.1
MARASFQGEWPLAGYEFLPPNFIPVTRYPVRIPSAACSPSLSAGDFMEGPGLWTSGSVKSK